MTVLEELALLRDDLVTMAGLGLNMADFITNGLDNPETMDEDWVVQYQEKMEYMAMASSVSMSRMIGEETTTEIFHMVEEAQDGLSQ